MSLEMVSFLWNEEKSNGDNRKHFGQIAQDAETVISELVVTDADGYKAINYIELIPFLVRGMQEQQQLIEQLQTELESLKN
ncbi:tail fiber domain-containing protein [candidate division KSB1 bacterium]|nr:tail fiber domain-containing protein [candidate division KSB1 bacterium]